MNYYQHHIGDFNSATRYLTLVERALYRDLIEMYYDTEQAIDASDFERLARRLLCKTEDEKTALKYVLSEFFTLENGYYYQSRCEREIAEYQAKKEQQVKAGKASAAKRASSNKAAAKDTTNDRSTTVQPQSNDRSTNHKPITNNQEPLTNDLYTNTGEQKNSLDDDLNLWNPSLDEINTWRKRAGLLETTQEEFNHTMVTFMPHYAPQIRIGTLKQNQVFSKYIAWVKRDYKPLTSTPKAKPQPQMNNRNVNQAWGDIPEHAPADPDVAARLAASLAEEDYL